jgi:hypothetical protein
MANITDQVITEALFAGSGNLINAARHLSEQLGRPVTREMVAQRAQGSRVLTAVRQIAEERAWDRTIAGAWRRRKERRSAAMKASWVEWRARAAAGSDTAPDDPHDLEHLDAPNARGRARARQGL